MAVSAPPPLGAVDGAVVAVPVAVVFPDAVGVEVGPWVVRSVAGATGAPPPPPDPSSSVVLPESLDSVESDCPSLIP